MISGCSPSGAGNTLSCTRAAATASASCWACAVEQWIAFLQERNSHYSVPNFKKKSNICEENSQLWRAKVSEYREIRLHQVQ